MKKSFIVSVQNDLDYTVLSKFGSRQKALAFCTKKEQEPQFKGPDRIYLLLEQEE